MVIVGGTFIIVTILFKIGAVPFHAWVVDVYHGAPYPVTMFMASTFKIAVFAIALRLYLVDFATVQTVWTPILQAVTVLTLLGGSWLAISQRGVKRMLAICSGVTSCFGGYGCRSSTQRTFKPVRVVVLAIRWTMVACVSNGLPRQF